MNFIARGAEAILYKTDSTLIKKRIAKGYRIPEIDQKLRKERTQREARLMTEARRNGITVPVVVEKDMIETKLVIEFINGPTLRDALNTLPVRKLSVICSELGKMIGLLHKSGIIHGDLTTSNFILNNGNKVYLIDFGLGEFSTRMETRAVDLHVLLESLIAKHNKIWKKSFECIMKGYLNEMGAEGKKVLDRLETIRKRGRYARK